MQYISSYKHILSSYYWYRRNEIDIFCYLILTLIRIITRNVVFIFADVHMFLSPTIFRKIVIFYRWCNVQFLRLRCSETVLLIDVAMSMQVYRGFRCSTARYHKTDIICRFSLYHYCYIVKWILLNFFLQKKFLTDCQ